MSSYTFLRSINLSLSIIAPIAVFAFFPTLTLHAQTNPIAAYSFSEGTGLTTADASGNGRTGTLTNGPVWTTAGKYGNALSYDGSNDYVSISNTLDISALPFTVSAWINPANYNDYRNIVGKRDTWNATDMRFNLVLGIGDGHVMFQQPSTDFNFTYAPPPNSWTHLAVVADAAGTRLYADGILQQTLGVFTLGNDATAQWRIGMNADGPDPFLGKIDDLRMYNRALTQTEVQTDMNTPVP